MGEILLQNEGRHCSRRTRRELHAITGAYKKQLDGCARSAQFGVHHSVHYAIRTRKAVAEQYLVTTGVIGDRQIFPDPGEGRVAMSVTTSKVVLKSAGSPQISGDVEGKGSLSSPALLLADPILASNDRQSSVENFEPLLVTSREEFQGDLLPTPAHRNEATFEVSRTRQRVRDPASAFEQNADEAFAELEAFELAF